RTVAADWIYDRAAITSGFLSFSAILPFQTPEPDALSRPPGHRRAGAGHTHDHQHCKIRSVDATSDGGRTLAETAYLSSVRYPLSHHLPEACAVRTTS